MNDQAPGPRLTLKDVARAVGLSHGAVSLALRNSPEISKTTCQRVQEAAREMGYQPNPMATGLAYFKRTSKIVPVQAAFAWLNFWEDPKRLRGYREFDGYWRGAAAAAEKLGYRLEEFICDSRLPVSRIEKILLARGINGVLLPPHQSAPGWGDFHWERFSVVRFGRSMAAPRAHLVTADQAGNAMMAVDEIRARGYSRVGLVSAKKHKDRRWLFEAGFRMAQSELDDRDRVPVLTLDDEKSNLQVSQAEFGRWLKREKPDAVLTDHAGLPSMLKKCGCRVPEDIGLAVATVLDAGADAGIHQNPEEIGRVAVLVLLSLINDNARGVPATLRQILIEGRWVDGASLPRRG